VEGLRSLAEAKGVTVAQIAIAWVLAQGSDIVPLVGARKPERLAESLGALKVELSIDDLAMIEALIPAGSAAGARYNDYLIGDLDSEKRSA
jgi:aryl-alcohol dehydrogenase-like predicted oxidoreductase